MKKEIFLFCIILIPFMLKGQITVFTDGDIGIESTDPQSKFCIGSDGSAYAKASIFNFNSNYGQRALMLNMSQPTGSWLYGMTSNITSGAGNAVAIYGKSYISTPSSQGRSYGVFGYAGNSTNGYNYAVYGHLLGSNNGAGVFGTISGDYQIPGKYAGFFYGDVKVIGEFWAYTVTESDKRYKSEISEISNCLYTVKQIQGIRYKLNIPVHEQVVLDTLNGDSFDVSNQQLYEKTHYGFIAQDLKEIYPDLVYESDDGYLGINYQELVPLLVESIKELSEEVDDLKLLINNINSNKKSTSNGKNNDEYIKFQVAELFQNNPNPFNEKTKISCYIPKESMNAELFIFDVRGTQKKKIRIAERAYIDLYINGGELEAGMYIYSLIVDGKIIDTKNMILTK